MKLSLKKTKDFVWHMQALPYKTENVTEEKDTGVTAKYRNKIMTDSIIHTFTFSSETQNDMFRSKIKQDKYKENTSEGTPQMYVTLLHQRHP